MQLKDATQKERESYPKDPPYKIENVSEKEVEINGFKALQVETTYSSSQTPYTATYILDEKGSVIEIFQSLDIAGGRKFYDQLLSSFKFTQ